jgi:hypothetical protein
MFSSCFSSLSFSFCHFLPPKLGPFCAERSQPDACASGCLSNLFRTWTRVSEREQRQNAPCASRVQSGLRCKAGRGREGGREGGRNRERKRSTHAYARTHACRTHAHTHTHKRTHAHTHTRTHAHTHTRTHTRDAAPSCHARWSAWPG